MRSTRVLALALLSACVVFEPNPAYGQPAPPREEMRARFGRSGVVVRYVDFERGVSAPVAGWMRGMGIGVLRGLGYVIGLPVAGGIVLSSAGPLGTLFGTVVGGAVGVVYFPVSIVGGALTAPSKEDVARIRAEVEVGLARFDLPSRLIRRFRTRAMSEALVSVVDLGSQSLPAEDEGPWPERWDRCDSVMLLDVLAMPASTSLGVFTVDGEYAMALAVRLRVMLKGEAEPVYDSLLTFCDETEKHRFADWGSARGRRLVAYLDRGVGVLVERFVDEVWLRYSGAGFPTARPFDWGAAFR